MRKIYHNMRIWRNRQTQGTLTVKTSEGILIMDIKIYVSKKDNRVRYYYKDENGNNHFGSCPRILMEQKLGRPLEPYEDVHHIDGNPLNNDLSNLEVVNHGEHQKEHSTKYVDTIETCVVCGKLFTMTGHTWSKLVADIHRGRTRTLTCSKSCAGKVGSGNYPHIKSEDLVSKSR